MFSRFKLINAITASVLIVFLASCTQKKNLDGTPVEDGPVSKVTVSADRTTTVSGGKVNLTATVEGSGAYNKTVTWKILSGGGTIKGEDTTAVYKADLAIEKSGPVVIEATARGDETKKGSTNFNVEATTSVVVNVSSWDNGKSLTYVNSPNIPVKLYNAGKQLIQEGVTDSLGNIEFLGLTPQEYTITEDVPVGYGVSGGGIDGYNPVSGRRIASRRLPLSTGPTYLKTGFLNTLAAVIGQVYVDKDMSEVREATAEGAGVLDPAFPGQPLFAGVVRNSKGHIVYSEAGVSKSTLVLTGTDLNGVAVKRTVVPDGNGLFEIPGLLSGKYTLSQSQQSDLADWNDIIVENLERPFPTGGFDRTTQVPKTASGSLVKILHSSVDRSDTTEEFAVNEGQRVGGFVFAESDLTTTGMVYVDRDRDGYRLYSSLDLRIEDPLPIPNVTLKISGNGQAETAVSIKDGTYFFDRAVPPGSYTLTEEQPKGYGDGRYHVIGQTHFTFPSSASDLNSTTIVIPQRISSGIDPSTLRPVRNAATVASAESTTKPVEFADEVSNIYGTVFLDDNGNGIRDLDGIATDPGLVLNVPMQLTGSDVLGNPVSKVVSLNKYGHFVFPDLLEGTYKIEQIEQPQNYRDGITRAGFIGPLQVGIGGISNVISGINLPRGVDAGGFVPFICDPIFLNCLPDFSFGVSLPTNVAIAGQKPVSETDLRIIYTPLTKDAYTFGELPNPPKP
jgi:large repetitive protein